MDQVFGNDGWLTVTSLPDPMYAASQILTSYLFKLLQRQYPENKVCNVLIVSYRIPLIEVKDSISYHIFVKNHTSAGCCVMHTTKRHKTTPKSIYLQQNEFYLAAFL
jgi:hypothetical protein